CIHTDDLSPVSAGGAPPVARRLRAFQCTTSATAAEVVLRKPTTVVSDSRRSIVARDERPAIDPIAEARRQWIAHGWTEAAAGMTAVTSIMRAHQLLLARVDATLKPFGLTFARYELLTLLSFTREGRMPMA